MDPLVSNAKLIWLCRRGMLELDLILSRFLKNQLEHLSNEQRSVFLRMLDAPDPDLYAWFMGYETPEDTEVLSLVTLIRTHGTP